MPLRPLFGLLAKRATWLMLCATLLALGGCGLRSSSAYVAQPGPGSIKPIAGAQRVTLVVTGKQYTEALIMGKIAVLAARASGFHVKDLTGVPGSMPARELMTTHRADIMFDYTGTAWMAYFGHEKPIANAQAQWQAVHDEDLANGITWGPPAPLNDTYALAIRTADQAQLGGITRLSQIKNLPVSKRTFCVESEFYSRQDGFRPMLKTYGLTLGAPDGVPNANVSLLDAGAVYEATAHGKCTFGEVYTTDGRIKSLHLLVLQDDKHFFPSYDAAPLFRTKLAQKFPQLEKTFAAITAHMTNAVFQNLNGKVDIDGESPAHVAFAWMVSQGFISRAK